MYQYKEIYMQTPVGTVLISGHFTDMVRDEIEEIWQGIIIHYAVEQYIFKIRIEQIDNRWFDVTTNISERVYFHALHEYLNMILNMVFCKEAEKKGLLLIHGSGCMINNCTLIVVGTKGSGKTTLLTQLIMNGAKCISDDTIFLNPCTNSILPFGNPIRMKEGSALTLLHCNNSITSIRKVGNVTYTQYVRVGSEVNADNLFIIRADRMSDQLLKKMSAIEILQELLQNIKNPGVLHKYMLGGWLACFSADCTALRMKTLDNDSMKLLLYKINERNMKYVDSK